MKRNIIILSLLTLTVVSTINAQSASPAAETEDSVAPLRKNGLMERNETVQKRDVVTIEDKEARRDEFKAQLEEMRDVRKQAMIERVDEKINNFNQTHTTKLQTGLTRMQSVLDGIATKAATLNNEELDTAIESAQEAIDTAEETVTSQLEKEYVIDLEDETQIRTAAREIFTEFRTDLKAVHTAVKEAHMAVVKAARMLPKTTVNADEEEETSNDETDPLMRMDKEVEE